MKDFLELVKTRQSDRSYDPGRAVETEKLEYILEAARLAPSANNAQPWKFVVLTDPKIRQLAAEATADKTLGMNKFVLDAPVLVVVVEDSNNLLSILGGAVKNKHFPHIDLGIAVAHLTLAAAEQGLGSCILGWFDEKKMHSILNIPNQKRPLMVVALGYSIQPPRSKKRKEFRDVVRFNSY
jgi:nitroreductase